MNGKFPYYSRFSPLPVQCFRVLFVPDCFSATGGCRSNHWSMKQLVELKNFSSNHFPCRCTLQQLHFRLFFRGSRRDEVQVGCGLVQFPLLFNIITFMKVGSEKIKIISVNRCFFLRDLEPWWNEKLCAPKARPQQSKSSVDAQVITVMK